MNRRMKITKNILQKDKMFYVWNLENRIKTLFERTKSAYITWKMKYTSCTEAEPNMKKKFRDSG